MVKDKAVCLDCHTKVPEPEETAPDYFLIDLPSENCLACHSEFEHSGVEEHSGKDAKPLPGDENGKIACFTCHDPHPQSVIEGRRVYTSELSDRTRAFIDKIVYPAVEKRVKLKVTATEKREALLRLPSSGNELCMKCHENLKDAKYWREKALWEKFIGIFSY
ncbi:MAG: cytochrome c3 family protein [Candidatus Caldarchaeum sp.]